MATVVLPPALATRAGGRGIFDIAGDGPRAFLGVHLEQADDNGAVVQKVVEELSHVVGRQPDPLHDGRHALDLPGPCIPIHVVDERPDGDQRALEIVGRDVSEPLELGVSGVEVPVGLGQDDLALAVGILVDDATVTIENIERHHREKKGQSFLRTAVEATDEVGNPTILATFTVIAAILPMAFVSGLMGPYMLPIPTGASAAMLFSFFVAVCIAPWMLLKLAPKAGAEAEDVYVAVVALAHAVDLLVVDAADVAAVVVAAVDMKCLLVRNQRALLR